MSERPSDNSTGDQTENRAEAAAAHHVVADVLLYSGARLLLAAVLAAAIYGIARLLGVAQFPIVVAALFALIIAMPLGIWVFSPLRRRATVALTISGERRRREREQLQARLRGEAVGGEVAHPESDEE